MIGAGHKKVFKDIDRKLKAATHPKKLRANQRLWYYLKLKKKNK